MGKNFSFFAVVEIIGLLYNAGHVLSSADIMKQMTKGFGATLEDCRKELNLHDDVLKEMMNFWNREYELVSRDVGCAIICMTGKLGLHTEDGKVHHGKLAEFAKKHGADDAMCSKLVELLHGCEKWSEGKGDQCVQKLEMAKCFRTKAAEAGWAPDFDELVQEMMAEAQA